ncbi:MAG: DUF411 domain-containing protein [Rubrivivax sp.]|nr:DUF411 domain-containing protein [Rubrivivax sp.]
MSLRVNLRRRWLLTAAAAVALPAWATRAAKGGKPMVEVWKSPSCGCCGDWIKHLEANGFEVKAFDVDDASKVRRRVGFADKYGSCHTALVGGYALEGHVPAREIKRLLNEKPQGVVGIAVPGMPLGSPGMDGPIYGGQKTPYDVVLVKRDGSASVYQSYR